MPDNSLNILQTLASLLTRKPPAAEPEPDVDMLRPWDSPVLRTGDLLPPVSKPYGEALNAPAMAPTVQGQVTPSDDALLQAILRKRLNQQFAAAGNQPIPQ